MCETPDFPNAPLEGIGVREETIGKDFVRLSPVDSVDLTIVMDNSIDYLLTSDKEVRRYSFSAGWSKKPQLIAEHGYSVFLKVRNDGGERCFLYDAGLTAHGILRNIDLLGIPLEDLEAVVLSHGHSDHHGGLLGIVRRIGKKQLPLILHPDSWRNRKLRLPSGVEFELPPPNKEELEKADVQIVEERGPSLLLGDEVLVTGQVERVTDFEKGLPSQYAEDRGNWVPDPWVWDDQGIVCNLKGKGLIVVSSCSHSGVINVLRNARKVTGIQKVHAFVGGLHLPKSFEEIIPPTVDEIKSLRPERIIPGHCSGWMAIHEVANNLPDAFIPSTVGAQIHFG